ncbi:cytochrome P450 CYP94D108-like [Miscanthus floridulus]|uniref:cytochrome P450 CYP94D108-like n=1 Tax=Miscanthus floridulus TaxID=154761 RepID=UPI00345B45A5
MTEALERQTTCTFVLRRPGGVRGAITTSPANVEHVLRTSFDNYPKGPRFSSLLHDFLGRGIFTADGEAWRAQRKVASHEFTTRSLRAFVARCVHAELHGRLLPLLRRAAASGAPLDLQDALERFAFDNICRVAFDHDPRQLADNGDYTADCTFADAFRDAANLSVGRFRYAVPGFWKIKKALNVGSEKRLRESIAMVHDFADRIIQSRREEMLRAGFDKHDLLSRFMASQDETYSESKVPLRDVVISFLLAGRETTSSALTWFFCLLSSRPDVQRRIRDEVAAVRARRAQGDVNNVIGFDLDELREMHYVHAAITESMRLYPPVPLNTLRAETDDVLPDGTAVRAGWFVTYTSYGMGRMESVWGDDAREYRPERWLNPVDGTFRPDSPFRFVAFHAGPRLCVGKEMAYIQMKSIVACVLEELDVAVDGAYRPRQVASLTLRMADGSRDETDELLLRTYKLSQLHQFLHQAMLC